MEEVGEACVVDQRIEVFMNSIFAQEIIAWPFTRPYFRYARKIILGLFLLFSLFFLGALARRAPQKFPLSLLDYRSMVGHEFIVHNDDNMLLYNLRFNKKHNETILLPAPLLFDLTADNFLVTPEAVYAH